jgi:lipoprotein signal peptidase
MGCDYVKFVLLSAFILTLDQFTKRIAEKKIALGKEIELIKNKLYLTNIRNNGAAYGLFAKRQKILAILK